MSDEVLSDFNKLSDAGVASVCRQVADGINTDRHSSLRALLHECAYRLENYHLDNIFDQDIYQ